MIAVPKKFQDKICVSAKVYIDNGRKVLKHLPKSWQLAKESVLDNSKGQDNLVLLTGPVNNVICFDIDCMDFWELHKGMFLDTTYMEESFSGKIHLYYKYTPVLKSKKCGQFDILSTACSAILGKPMNDLPINEMSPELIEFINVDLLNKNYKDNSKIVSLISKDYVRSKENWITVGKFLKLTGCRYDDWILVSMKDRNGFSKNFDENGVNCMKDLWKSFHDSKKFIDTFNELLNKLADLHKKKKSMEKIDAKEKEINEFAPGLDQKYLQNGYKFQLFIGSLLGKIAKRLKDDNMLEYLLENELITSSDYKIKFEKSNHFDLDDDFYYNDLKRLLTVQGKSYRDGEVLVILAKNMHRVIAISHNETVFVKLSKTHPGLMVDLRYFNKFYISIPLIKKDGESTSFEEYITKRHPFIYTEMYFEKFKINFDVSYTDQSCFYATKRLIASPVDTKTDISMLIDFIKEIICNGNHEIYQYFMKWLSMLFQFPHVKSGRAVILYSEGHGCGKSMLVKFLCDYIFGCFNTIENMRYTALLGSKNACIIDKIFVCVNEVASSNSQKHLCQEQLKSLITEESQNVNRLYKENLTVDTSYSLMFCSNNKTCLKITNEDRRLFPIEVSDRRKQDLEYFSKFMETNFNQTIANQFAFHLISFLTSPSDFMKTPMPLTQIKKEMMDESEYLSPYWDFVYDGNVAVTKIFKHKKIEYHCWSFEALWSSWKLFQVDNKFGEMNSRSFLNKLKSSKKFENLKNNAGRYWAIESSKLFDSIDELDIED